MRLTKLLRDSFINSVMQEVPRIDYHEKARVLIQKDAISRLPKTVRAIYDDINTRHYVATRNQHFSFGGYINVVGKEYETHQIVEDQLTQFYKVSKVQDETHNALRTKLTTAAYACTSRKALVEMLPEFEKYMPEDEATVNRALPVVQNMLSDFVKAGWPKNALKMPAKLKAVKQITI